MRRVTGSGIARRLRSVLPALLLVVAGCASVPDLDRYMLKREPVRLEGAKGVLSREQTQKILAGLKQRTPDTAILDRHVAIEEALSGHPLSVGNSALILQDGKNTYVQMLAAIHGARANVNMEMYIFEDDETGQLFAEALKERAAAGVKVRLIYDSVGSHKTKKEFFQDLAGHGVQVAEYNPLTAEQFLKTGFALQRRDHRKLLVVDGRVAFVGGINVSGVYGSNASAAASKRTSDSAAPGASGGSSSKGPDTGSSGSKAADSGSASKGEVSASSASKSVLSPAVPMRELPFDKRPWRDLQVKLEGPVVADLQRAFLHQWNKAAHEDLDTRDRALFPQLSARGHEIIRVMESSAGDWPNPLYVALVSAIDNAETEVLVMNAYFVPHPDLLEALQRAAKRGVSVKLVLPSRSDNELVLHAGRSFYEDLLESGVHIFERQARTLHSKTALVDGVWGTIGSTNLDWRSLAYNDELNAVVLSPDFAQQLRAVFDRDIGDSREITREAWSHRGLLDRLKESGARLWAMML